MDCDEIEVGPSLWARLPNGRGTARLWGHLCGEDRKKSAGCCLWTRLLAPAASRCRGGRLQGSLQRGSPWRTRQWARGLIPREPVAGRPQGQAGRVGPRCVRWCHRGSRKATASATQWSRGGRGRATGPPAGGETAERPRGLFSCARLWNGSRSTGQGSGIAVGLFP